MSNGSAPPPDGLFKLLSDLDARHVAYRLDRVRPNSIMVVITVPGERWEVEYFADASVEVERFRSGGSIADETVIDELWPMTE